MMSYKENGKRYNYCECGYKKPKHLRTFEDQYFYNSTFWKREKNKRY